MEIGSLRTNHIDRPLGFWMDQARISYLVRNAEGTRQEAARVVVSSEEGDVLYDTGKVRNSYDETTGKLTGGIDNSCYILPISLQPGKRYYWCVCVWTDAGEMAWSRKTWFETPKGREAKWKADFIAPSFDAQIHPVFVKTFRAAKKLRTCRIYILGLGLYELYLNHEKVGDEVLQPGLHAYDSWLQYQTYELNCTEGVNELEVMLGNGWYKGRYGMKKSMPRYGEEFALIAEIHLCYGDGSEEIIGTDTSWQVKRSPVQSDTIYDGEIYDANMAGGELFPVKELPLDKGKLVPRKSPYLKIREQIVPKLILETPGYSILDMEQNMAGWVSYCGAMEKGERIRFSFGEIVKDGDLYTDNLRTAKAEFVYVSDGKDRTIRPHFTYFGFRYVKVEHKRGKRVRPQDFTGCAIYSEIPQRGYLETSDLRLNRLFENILWSQKSNFLDIPTDCPQRDERMGWTGDAQIFADTACFNSDCYAFYEKFCWDLYLEQIKCGGSVPYVVPMSGYHLSGAAVWGDAAVIIPWQVYLHYGDRHILEVQYPSMKEWVDYVWEEVKKTSDSLLWQSGRQFGDWLALDGTVQGGVYGATDPALIATAFFFHSAELVARAAGVLGFEEESETYQSLARAIRKDFIREYFTETGKLANPTQTAYALCICMKLYRQEHYERLAEAFREKVIHSRYMLETGFVGTPYLLTALSLCGYSDLAYRILLNTEYPGWLYAVEMGATTVWERWNSIEPDGRMNENGMNSLNHYAYGSVAAWLYQYAGGIQAEPDCPGFRRAVIAPGIDERLRFCRARYGSVNGAYTVEWRIEGKNADFCIQIPFGCRASFHVPENLQAAPDGRVLELGAGGHRFSCPLLPVRISAESIWEEVRNDPGVIQVMEQHFPRILKGIAFQEEQKTIGDIMRSPFSELTEEQIALIDEALGRL